LLYKTELNKYRKNVGQIKVRALGRVDHRVVEGSLNGGN